MRLNYPILFVFAGLMALATQAHAQQAGASVVGTCGTASYSSGKIYPTTQDTTGTLCTASGGGGGGNVTITAPLGTQTLAASVATTTGDGNDVALGAKADPVCGTATGTCTLQALVKFLNTAVSSSIPAGTNLIGSVQAVPGTTSGLSFATKTAANSDNCTNLKASAGNLYHVTGYSAAAVPTWVSFYNTAGTPTGGTGIVYQMLIPVNSTSGGGAVDDIPSGLSFATGIGYCITTGIAGTGSVAATSIVVNFGYK